MSWFNYPPDHEPANLAYFRDRKLKAKEIDPGMTIGEEPDEEVQETVADARSQHPSSGTGLGGHSAVCELRTIGTEGDCDGSADDLGTSWLRITNRR